MNKIFWRKAAILLTAAAIICGSIAACDTRPEGPAAVAIAFSGPDSGAPAIEWFPVPDTNAANNLPGLTLTSASFTTWLLPGGRSNDAGITVFTAPPKTLPSGLETLASPLAGIDYNTDFAIILTAGHSTLSLQRIWQVGSTVYIGADVYETAPEVLDGAAGYIVRMGRGLLPPFGEVNFKLIDRDGKEKAGTSVLLNKDKMTPDAVSARAKAFDFVIVNYGIPKEILLTLQQTTVIDAVSKDALQAVAIYETRPDGMTLTLLVDGNGDIMNEADYGADLERRMLAKYGRLDPELYDLLQGKKSDDAIGVAITPGYPAYGTQAVVDFLRSKGVLGSGLDGTDVTAALTKKLILETEKSGLVSRIRINGVALK